MDKLFIRIGEQTFAVNHITHVVRLGSVVEVSLISSPESIRLGGDDAKVFWEWHTSALNTTTLHVSQESEPVAVS